MEPVIKSMEDIKESLKILFDNEKIVSDFARNKYVEKINEMRRQPIDCYAYKGYDVISESGIKINYTYRYGSINFTDFFIVYL